MNVQDRELNAGSSDGFFSVLMSNRLPVAETKCRACLVSLEQRSDLLQHLPDSPPPFYDPPQNFAVAGGLPLGVIGAVGVGPSQRIFVRPTVRPGAAAQLAVHRATGPGHVPKLMQGLDVGMIGDVDQATSRRSPTPATCGWRCSTAPGENEIGWYRGPLVPWQLTRDPLGPYHSADQCRRVIAETGAEDVSYAAAFEVGRQLAAADARLARS